VAASLALGLCLSSPLAFAQTDEPAWDADAAPDEDNAEEGSEAEAAEEAGEEQARAADDQPTASGTGLAPLRVSQEHRPDAATYRLPKENVWSPLEWAGGRMHAQIELDVGYASYRYPERQDRPRESEYDMRGRFVLGPTFRLQLGNEYFLDVVGQLVAWVREQNNEYQINADDVYVQVGNEKWDLQVGRFMTWRVYQKGLGFDLYTLEDNGASRSYPISNGDFAVHTYEVDYIFLRNSPYVGGEVAGRAALHYYPLDILGFELATAYGVADNQGTNTLGVRFAGDLNWKFLRLTGAGEYRHQAQTGPPNAVQNAGTPDERAVECADCGSSSNKGIGGGLGLNFAPVNLGGNIAVGWDERYLLVGNADGVPGRDLASSGRRMSFGGFFEVDAGSLLSAHSLIVGLGANRTELVLDNFNKQFHLQSAAYAAWPLGTNNAMLKLVVSRAQADLYDATDPEGSSYIDLHPSSTALRLRFSTNF